MSETYSEENYLRLVMAASKQKMKAMKHEGLQEGRRSRAAWHKAAVLQSEAMTCRPPDIHCRDLFETITCFWKAGEQRRVDAMVAALTPLQRAVLDARRAEGRAHDK